MRLHWLPRRERKETENSRRWRTADLISIHELQAFGVGSHPRSSIKQWSGAPDHARLEADRNPCTKAALDGLRLLFQWPSHHQLSSNLFPDRPPELLLQENLESLLQMHKMITRWFLTSCPPPPPTTPRDWDSESLAAASGSTRCQLDTSHAGSYSQPRVNASKLFNICAGYREPISTASHSPTQEVTAPETFREHLDLTSLFYRWGNRSGVGGGLSSAQGHTGGVRDGKRTVVSWLSSLSRALSHLSPTTQCPPNWAPSHFTVKLWRWQFLLSCLRNKSVPGVWGPGCVTWAGYSSPWHLNFLICKMRMRVTYLRHGFAVSIQWVNSSQVL